MPSYSRLQIQLELVQQSLLKLMVLVEFGAARLGVLRLGLLVAPVYTS